MEAQYYSYPIKYQFTWWLSLVFFKLCLIQKYMRYVLVTRSKIFSETTTFYRYLNSWVLYKTLHKSLVANISSQPYPFTIEYYNGLEILLIWLQLISHNFDLIFNMLLG